MPLQFSIALIMLREFGCLKYIYIHTVPVLLVIDQIAAECRELEQIPGYIQTMANGLASSMVSMLPHANQSGLVVGMRYKHPKHANF